MKFLSALLLFVSGVSQISQVSATEQFHVADSKEFINDNVIRTIDVQGALVREKRAIAITRTAASSGLQYYLAVELPRQLANATIAYVSVHEKDSETSEPCTYVGSDKSLPERNIYYYVINVPSKFEKDRHMVMVDIVYSHLLEPLPFEIDQLEKQYMKYTGNIYMASPYETLKQKLKLTLTSFSIESYTKDGPIERSGKTLTYGPHDEKQPALAYKPLYVHFENNSPQLTDVEFTRELWLSHWASTLSVVEFHLMRHDGARLKEQFSRVNFAKSQQNHHATSVVKSMTFELPPKVSETYFRDDIGNVSTSNLRLGRSRSALELRPRFPLYGGWNYNWHHGYNLNLWDYVTKSDETGKHVMEIYLLRSLPNVPVDLFRVKVVLPEGATDIEISPKFNVPIQHTVTHTYLDTIGRPTIIFELKNLVDEHFVPFKVSYRYHVYEYFRKPLVLVGAYMIVFLTSMLYCRMDFTISRTKKK